MQMAEESDALRSGPRGEEGSVPPQGPSSPFLAICGSQGCSVRLIFQRVPLSPVTNFSPPSAHLVQRMDSQGSAVSPLRAFSLQHEITELCFGPVQSEDKRLKPGTVRNLTIITLNSLLHAHILGILPSCT